MEMNIDFIVDVVDETVANVEPNTLMSILQQMSAYTPPVEVEETVEVVKKTRGRPRKVKQVEGAIKHIQSEDGPEGRSITFREQRELELAFKSMQRETDQTITVILTKLANKHELTYKQAYALLMK